VNKLCKAYIKEVKSLFPVCSKKERKYIKNLTQNIVDFCEDSCVTSKEELYSNYGKPIDIVAEYFSVTGVSYVVNKVRISKSIRALIAAVLLAAIAVTSVFCVVLYSNHKSIAEQEVVSVETVIE
jgi:uncharacterized membrane protein